MPDMLDVIAMYREYFYDLRRLCDDMISSQSAYRMFVADTYFETGWAELDSFVSQQIFEEERTQWTWSK